MKLTQNFNLSEFHCKDGTPVPEKYYPNVQELANNLQVLRDTIGVPVTITGSGYRTPSHNKKGEAQRTANILRLPQQILMLRDIPLQNWPGK